MTRMADPERPRDEHEYDDERFEDEGRRSIFSALWFRAILVVIVLGVVAAVAVPYVLEIANQPAPKTTALGKPEVTPAPPPVASTPVAPTPMQEKSPTPDKPAAMDKPSTSESPAATGMTPATESPAPKRSESSNSTAASKSAMATPKEQPASRAPRVGAPSPAGPGDYFVQVGAFKNPDTAKKVAARLREQKYNVAETSASGVKTARAATPSASGAPSDRYDVYVSGGAPGDINSKLAARGLSAEPSGAGVVVKPSMPLRDAVALSKDLAVDGLKVQVRRAAAGGPASAPPPSSGAAGTSDGTLYRVRVGPFDDKSTATSTLRELQQKGYTPFIARGGQ
jgi:cell division septation protein DedD